MKTAYNLLILGFVVVLLATVSTPILAACTSRYSKQCVSNISYWYNSCGALESVAQNCNTTNQICQGGQCVNKPSTGTGGNTGGNTGGSTGGTGSSGGSANHAVKSCYNGDIYWFGSNGMVNDLYQKCSDNNACTLDNCAGNQCVNQLKCDGSTCAQGSADFNTHCQGVAPSPNDGQNFGTDGNQNPGSGQQIIQGQGLAVAVFTSLENAWQKSIAVKGNDPLTFMIVVKNTAQLPIDAVTVTASLANITYTGNLKVDNVVAAGDVATGINLGAMPAKSSKLISFTGTVNQNVQGTFQVNANVSSRGTFYDSDFVSLSGPNPTATGTSPTVTGSSAGAGSSFGGAIANNFKKNWYIWLLIVIILVVVFIIIFRKLSTTV